MSERKRILAICTGIATIVLGIWSCDKASPTKPTPAPTPVAVSTPAPVAVASPQPEPSPTPKPDRPVNAICEGDPIMCHFETDHLRPVNAVCTAPGQHNDWGSWNGTTDDVVSPLDICDTSKIPSVPEERCAPVTINVQIDFHAAGRHAGHLGPSWAITFPANLTPEECTKCEEWEEPEISTECRPFGECHPVVQALNGEEAPSCTHERYCVDTFSWNCKDPEKGEPYLDSEPCEDCCIPEWGPWTVIDSHVDETECAPVRGEDGCAQTITTTFLEESIQSCTEERRTRRRQVVETVPCDCEDEGEGCHLSNQGAPGDTNFNVVLTTAPAHQSHTQATHCPGDIFPPNDCTCDQAFEQAKACGDPAAGGFYCK
jgi:hypothetical protein